MLLLLSKLNCCSYFSNYNVALTFKIILFLLLSKKNYIVKLLSKLTKGPCTKISINRKKMEMKPSSFLDKWDNLWKNKRECTFNRFLFFIDRKSKILLHLTIFHIFIFLFNYKPRNYSNKNQSLL